VGGFAFAVATIMPPGIRFALRYRTRMSIPVSITLPINMDQQAEKLNGSNANPIDPFWLLKRYTERRLSTALLLLAGSRL
jgi:hypothetical protein